MQITWHGQSCFSIKSKTPKGEEVITLINPYDEKITGLTLPKTKANIVLLGDKEAKIDTKKFDDNFFLIDQPGEFEIKDNFVSGMVDDTDEEKKARENTIFFLDIEGIKILNLGNITNKFKSNILEKISEVDILMIPVGGNETINAEKAVEIINEIEPRIVIPMNFHVTGLKEKADAIDKFTKEMAIENQPMVDKFKIEKKNLPIENTEVVILEKK